MKNRLLIVPIPLFFAAAALALMAGQNVQQYGPYPGGSPDSGTCGNFWAQDTFVRFFRVDLKQNADGSYNVVEQFKNGTFVTNAGASPGGCEGGATNPPQIPAGIEGKMQGQFWIVVRNGTFNPNATPPAGANTAQFVAAVFGASATLTIPSFSLNYNTDTHGDWRNASRDKGGNKGDIR